MKNDKLVSKDIGFVEEIIELCKNLVSIESHSFSSYLLSSDEKWLKTSKKARAIRTRYLDLITKKGNGQSWCVSKHLCECLMRLQECYTRFLSTEQTEEAKQCAVDYGELFLLFYEINDLMDGDIKSSA